jgi:fructose-bisphosphate aldolase class II
MLTDPEEAAVFVKATQLDALAIAIGTSHGAYKFSRKPTGDILAISRIKEIHTRIPNTHLVMHGSSSRAAGPAGHHQPVRRQDEADLRRAGGRDPGSHQARRAQDQHRHRHPLAMTGAVRKFLAENPDKFDAREWLKPAREAAKLICRQRYVEFGCEGQAPKIKAITLSDVARCYAAANWRKWCSKAPGALHPGP